MTIICRIIGWHLSQRYWNKVSFIIDSQAKSSESQDFIDGKSTLVQVITRSFALAPCEENPLVSNGFPNTGPVILIFYVFFVVSQHMLLNQFSVIWNTMKLIWRHCKIYY